MNSSIVLIIFLIFLLYSLSYVSRHSLIVIFNTLSLLFRSKKIASFFISLIYLPGTFLHESAHAVSATLLMLKLDRFSVWPKFENGGLRLGYVTYFKRDVFRSILVGVAPVFLGIFLLLAFPLVQGPTFLKAYAIFVITGTMFSSKQDMKDAIFIIPLLIMLAVIFLLFPEFGVFIKPYMILGLEYLSPYMYDVVEYVLLALAAHAAVFIIFKILLILFIYAGKNSRSKFIYK